MSYWIILSPVWFESEGLVWIITEGLWLNLELPIEAPADSPGEAVPALGHPLCWGEAHGLLLAVLAASSSSPDRESLPCLTIALGRFR